MTRTLNKTEVGMVILRLVTGGFFPNQHFVVTRSGQIMASPEARAFLRRNLAWIEAHQHVSDRPSSESE
ncbi:MAG: hypothetical protein VKL39_21925 [Leptolyngbyaceae bacterium]|nr:hypothetical protein [Leptolyngbyaceae bacterium]